MAKKGSFISDFKEFISRGNVVDMAVGVVIGGAFGKIVTGLVNYIINPVIGAISGGTSLDGIKTVIKAAEGEDPEVAILWGTWIQTIIDFLLVALCIFVVIRALAKVQNAVNAKKIAEEEAKKAEDAKKAEEEKKAAEEAAAALAAKQAALEEAQLATAKSLAQIVDLMKKK